jgi:type III secretion protein J
MARNARWIVCTAVLMLLGGCKAVLFAKLSEAQANEVVAALSQAQMQATKTPIDESSWQVEVEEAKTGTALVYLRNRGVPAQPAPNLGEVFKKDSLISSPLEERARYAAALQEDIATTLRRIDGIADARVHVAMPHNDPLSQRVVPVSAAVFVKHRPSLDIEMVTPSIKSMVMASVEGLDFRNVSLIAFRTDSDVAAPPQPAVRSAGWIDAHAASPDEAALPASRAGIVQSLEQGASALAGLLIAGAAGWWMRRRKQFATRKPVVAQQAAGPMPHGAAGNAAHAVPANAHGPSPSPSAQPGLFDTVRRTEPE